MKINGFGEFAARIASIFRPSGIGGPGSSANSSPAADSFDFSAMRGHMKFEAPTRLVGGNVMTSSSKGVAGLMENSFNRMKEIIEEMNTLAVKAAEDTSLNDFDRMRMQIRMEDLRMELYNTTHSMREKLAKEAGYEGKRNEVQIIPPADYAGVLERALERIDEGQPWDVAEGGRQQRTYTHISLSPDSGMAELIGDTSVYPKEGEMITLTRGKDWIIEEKSSYKERLEVYVMEESERYIYTAKRDPEGRPIDENGDGNPDMDLYVVPTVREKMEAANTIILMDAESAKKGVKRLEYEMHKYQSMREEFDKFKADPQQNRDLTKSELDALNATYDAMQKDLLAKQEDGEESWKTKLFLTEIGIMKTDEEGNNPKLVYAVGPKGSMFSKLSRFFDNTLRNVANGFIDESVYMTGAVCTNLQWEGPEKAESADLLPASEIILKGDGDENRQYIMDKF